MGLTLNYKILAPVTTTADRNRDLVAAMHAVACALQRAGRVKAVGRIGSSPKHLAWLSEWQSVPVPGEPHTSRGIEVPAVAGYVFCVTLGEDSEPLRLGLCRYPTQVTDPQTGRKRAVRRRGWRLAGFCKTQYASLHGWEHFRRCHTAAVDLLASLPKLGVKVEINDEGGYWPGRDEAGLRRMLDRMNGIVAAFAGAMKDAADESGGAPVQSPILAHPQFERLEAEGIVREGATINQAAEIVNRLGPHGPGTM